MKASLKGVIAVIALGLSCSCFACKDLCGMEGVNMVGGKTVGWLGDTGGKVTKGVADVYGGIMGATFQATDKMLQPMCDKCGK